MSRKPVEIAMKKDGTKYKKCLRCRRYKPLSNFYSYHFIKNVNVSDQKRTLSYCKECCAKIRKEEKLRNPWRFRAKRIMQNAKKRGLSCDDSLAEILQSLWVEQRGVCAYTGHRMALHGNSAWKVSVDRVNPTIGYHDGNLVLCALWFNKWKQNLFLFETAMTSQWFADLSKSITRSIEKMMATSPKKIPVCKPRKEVPLIFQAYKEAILQ